MTGTGIRSPRSILLATDLTCRCDRALDRATLLSGAWDADLVAAYVVDPSQTPQHFFDRSRRRWQRIPDPLERMRWRIRRDLLATKDDMRFVLEEGDPGEKLLEIAAREDCDLIVTGMAQQGTLERMFLGSTITRLVRGAPCPVLVVQDRGTRPYRRLTVATDFSDASFQALLTAGTFFPECSIALFHAYDIPFAGFLDHGELSRDLAEMEDEVRTKVLSDERIDPALRSRITVVIEHGTPEALLEDFVEDQQMDLTVIGSRGRGAVFDALIGSTAKRLVETLEGDLLIVLDR